MARIKRALCTPGPFGFPQYKHVWHDVRPSVHRDFFPSLEAIIRQRISLRRDGLNPRPSERFILRIVYSTISFTTTWRGLLVGPVGKASGLAVGRCAPRLGRDQGRSTGSCQGPAFFVPLLVGRTPVRAVQIKQLCECRRCDIMTSDLEPILRDGTDHCENDPHSP